MRLSTTIVGLWNHAGKGARILAVAVPVLGGLAGLYTFIADKNAKIARLEAVTKLAAAADRTADHYRSYLTLLLSDKPHKIVAPPELRNDLVEAHALFEELGDQDAILGPFQYQVFIDAALLADDMPSAKDFLERAGARGYSDGPIARSKAEYLFRTGKGEQARRVLAEVISSLGPGANHAFDRFVTHDDWASLEFTSGHCAAALKQWNLALQELPTLSAQTRRPEDSFALALEDMRSNIREFMAASDRANALGAMVYGMSLVTSWSRTVSDLSGSCLNKTNWSRVTESELQDFLEAVKSTGSKLVNK